MKCTACNVNVYSSRNICPLCGAVLITENKQSSELSNNHNHHFEPKPKYKKFNFSYADIIYISIAWFLAVSAVFLNIFVYKTLIWAPAFAMLLWYFWVTIRLGILRGDNILRKIKNQILAITLTLSAICLIEGGFLIVFAIAMPIVYLILFISALSALIKNVKTPRAYVSTLFLVSLFCFIPIVGLLISQTSLKTMIGAIIIAIIGAIGILATTIGFHKALIKEFKLFFQS